MDVLIEDPKQVADREKMAKAYNDRLRKARKEALRIEMFIRDIPDSELRQIFQYRYIDGMKMWEVGKRMNMERSNVGKKIHNYLNFPPIPQNAVI